MRGRRARRTCPGLTLVEVLVALFVVAFGIAGAATVQAMAMRAAGEAGRLADGMRLAASLAERMRANPAAMALDDAANPYLQFDVEAGALPAASAADCYGASACDAAGMAGFDLHESATQLASRFPNGRMRVCRDAPAPAAAGLPGWACSGAPADPVVIKLGWRARQAAPGAAYAPIVFLALGSGAP